MKRATNVRPRTLRVLALSSTWLTAHVAVGGRSRGLGTARLWVEFARSPFLLLRKKKISSKRVTDGNLPRLFADGRPQRIAPRSSRTARSRRILARIAGCLRLSRPEGPPTRPGSRDGSPRSPGGPPLKRHPARASDRARDRRPRPRHDCKPAFVRGARSCAERMALLALHPSRPARIGGRLEACLPRAPNPDAPPRTGPAKKKARRVRPKNRR